MKESDNIGVLLQDIKEMLMGLAILIVGGFVLVCGGMAFLLGLISMIAGAGFVWQGWHNQKLRKSTTEWRFSCLLKPMNKTASPF